MPRLPADFVAKATSFTAEYQGAKEDLEKCLQSKVGDDINFVCRKSKEKYLLGIAKTFCNPEYERCASCQKNAGEAWQVDCKQENIKFGHCTDIALRKMYIFNMEQERKEGAPVKPWSDREE